MIWDQYFCGYTTIEQKRLAVLVHALAAVAIICVWIVHVYAAIWVRGTIRAMTRGQGHRRLGLAASSQMAARTGRRQDKLNDGRRPPPMSGRRSPVCHVARAVREVADE